MKPGAESKGFSRNYSLNIRGRLLDLSQPRVMGVINVTPDSFYAGSRVSTEAALLQRVERMLKGGADIVDVGGQSTRPGAPEVPLQEEKDRLVSAVRLISAHFPELIISCDTYRSEVVEAAVSEGASMVNDISAGSFDPKMFETVARLRVPYVLMHMRGTPITMTGLNIYDNLITEVIESLTQKLSYLLELGVQDVLVDPGFGFAKSPVQNFEMLKKFEMFHALGRPLLVGLSRKSFIWRTLQITPEQALNGTTVVNTLALTKGASVLRVHDVAEAAEAVRLYMAYEKT